MQADNQALLVIPPPATIFALSQEDWEITVEYPRNLGNERLDGQLFSDGFGKPGKKRVATAYRQTAAA